LGAAFIVGGISFMANHYVRFVGYILAALQVIFILFIFVLNFLDAGSTELGQYVTVRILKEMAMAGNVLHIAASAHEQHFHVDDID
jgi:hypothetical protein